MFIAILHAGHKIHKLKDSYITNYIINHRKTYEYKWNEPIKFQNTHACLICILFQAN